jgi:hypothetical protein
VAEQETIRTESMMLAATLMAHGFDNVGTERPPEGSRKRTKFVVNIPDTRHAEAQEIVEVIRLGESGLLTDTVLYERSRNLLRDMLEIQNGGDKHEPRRRT